MGKGFLMQGRHKSFSPCKNVEVGLNFGTEVAELIVVVQAQSKSGRANSISSSTELIRVHCLLFHQHTVL